MSIGNRRNFLKNSTLSGLGTLVLANSALVKGYSANEKVDIALIGIGGRGEWFVDTIPQMENVVAICDANEVRAAKSFQKLPNVPKFKDFRKMLDEMGPQIDAVIIAVPDHNHAVITASAMKQGKHVYCEKPLTRKISEARTLRTLAHECKVVTQMGNQGTASEAFRRSVEIIQSGVLGNILEVHAWNTGGGAGSRSLPVGEPQPVPDTLAWDVWLGPALERPFHPEWLQWHAWRDFATGQLGNWAIHTMNVIFKGLKLDSLWNRKSTDQRIKVYAEISGIHESTFPRREVIHYEFPEREDMPSVRVNWYNGNGRAPAPREYIEGVLGRKLDWGDAGEKKWQDHAGCLLVGTKGALHSNGHNTQFTLLPQDQFKDYVGPEKSLLRSPGHEQEWISAIKGKGQPMSNFDYAVPHTEFALLGNIATLYPEGFEYDPVAMKINQEKADQEVHHQYRNGWSL